MTTSDALSEPLTEADFETASIVPFPPIEMRRLVGPTDLRQYDNPTGKAVLQPCSTTGSFFDFGCGCGRIARWLILQHEQPKRYLGIDLNRPMVDWCRTNLTPVAPQFRFEHHDVYNPQLNPSSRTLVAPFPADDHEFDTVHAHSVFTHIIEPAVKFYLSECARILKQDGVFRSTWFLIDKREFPAMLEQVNALYMRFEDPTAAVFYDRQWLLDTFREVGLVFTRVVPPPIRGGQWAMFAMSAESGATAIEELPEDVAPLGSFPKQD